MTAPIECLAPFDKSADAIPLYLVSPDDLAAGKRLPAGAREWVATVGFKAGEDSVCLVPGPKGTIRAVLVGLGGRDVRTLDPFVIAAVPAAVPAGLYKLAGGGKAFAEAAALGWCLAQYGFDRYKANNGKAPVVLMLPDGADPVPVWQLAEAVTLVRDLVNTPAEDMGPDALQDAAEELAEDFGATVSTLVGEELLDENYPMIHAVGRAAGEGRDPRIIELLWGDEDAPKVTLVGKGVCFDTGGLDLKSASGMRMMKKDMGGAAHALGLARLIMSRDLDVRLRVLVPAVENAVSGGAFRPGDIFPTRKGLSVEIGNTDAEGRLILSDALAAASEDAPELLIDFATLTGAARVALGPELPPAYTNDESLWRALEQASHRERDPMWRMPLHAGYRDDLDSPVADLCNSSDSGFAGSITAALFLQKFVDPEIPWLHFDIYAWNAKPRPGRPKGGEAQVIRALLALLEDRYGKD